MYDESSLWAGYRWYVAGAITLLLLQTLVIVKLLTQRVRRQQAEQAVRTSEAALRDSLGRIRHLTGRLIDAHEVASARIARDLHDDVCQQLAGISLAVRELRHGEGAVADPCAQDALAALQQRMAHLVDAARRLSHDLHPATLRHVGLGAALEAHCVEIEQRYDVQVSFATGGDLRRLSVDDALCLYRISQEALRNAGAHADARRIMVEIAVTPGGTELIVDDDGRGFDLDHVRRRGSGLGLVSMEERAYLRNGAMRIASAPGKGTRIHVHLPVPAAAKEQPS